MRKWMKITAAGLLAVVVAGGTLVYIMRGPTGATTDYGGALPAMTIPEFTSLDKDRWVNGEPTSLASVRGQVVILEAWHPA